MFQRFRVMTYNVHSCRGVDGRVDPKRIAEVIETFSPDIVALQELDVNRSKTNNMDQPLEIANHLRMQCHFQPVVAVEGEHYGIAVLSRYPFEIVRADRIKSLYPQDTWQTRVPLLKYLHEPREMIWVRVDVGTQKVNFLNTHLGLRARERRLQAEEVLSDKWLGAVSEDAPTVICGDFNAGPKSSVYQKLSSQLKEVKDSISHTKLRKTFFSHCPLFELDHIFYQGKIQLNSASVCATNATRNASDHLPVIADFELQEN